ncbi:MAG: hypothetical protein CL862_01920 [Cyanobium sp. NAT70]|nr:hypothetical protein [Cyanobium sp. NAT70]
MATSDSGSDLVSKGYRERLAEGRRAMAHLIHVWHERNGWSHKVLPSLAEALDLGRVHNSQISNLRNGKLAAPGPEVFLALGQANAVLFAGLDPIRDRLSEPHADLLQHLNEGHEPLVNGRGKPLGAGALFEIFVGLASLPPGFDWRIDETEASALSAALADQLCDGKTWRFCRDQVMAAYPVSKKQRRERFAAVMAGMRDYSADELDGELLDLYGTHQALGGACRHGAEGFLALLRKRAKSLQRETQSEQMS